MSSMRSVAKAAGVSVMTVSRYFNQPEMLAEPTRMRVERAIRDLRYVPNHTARSLVRGTSDAVGLIVSDVTNPFFTTLTRGVEDALHASDKTLILGNTDETPDKERRYLDVMISRRIDGIILAPVTDDREHITILRDQSIPVVLVDRTVPDADLDVVRSDVRQGGRQMTDHLLEHGHRQIAFIGGRRELSSLQERLRGYEDAMGSRDLPTTVELGNFDRASGVAAVDQLFGRMPVAGAAKVTALVAANNYVAVGAVARLRELGLRVPGDVSIVSFDDFEVEALVDPFFTVVKQPAYDIGRHAAAMLLERMSGLAVAARELVLPVTFIERHSVEHMS